MSPASSQLHPHHAVRVDLPGRFGPVAALRADPRQASADDGGALALLLPGYTGSKEDFAPLLDPIADTGIEALAVDLPGQYESAGPETEMEYLPSMLAVVFVELVEKLAADGRTVLLLGHSFGGIVARATVLAGAPIDGLTLLDSGPAELPEGERRAALTYGAPVLRADGVEAVWRYRDALNQRWPQWQETPEELRQFKREVFVRSSAAGLLGMGQALLDEPDLTDPLADTLRRSGVPCSVVCGESDDAWPPALQEGMAARLSAEFHTIPGARHSPNVENPQALLDVLLPTWQRWLAG